MRVARVSQDRQYLWTWRGAPLSSGRCFAFLLLRILSGLSPAAAGGTKPICAIGEEVSAFYNGRINLGRGDEPCQSTMERCWLDATVSAGPNGIGIYTVDWADGRSEYKNVHSFFVRRKTTEEPCGESPEDAVEDDPEDDGWIAPDLACTTLIRLHWEGSEPQWNKQAINALKAECLPDEVIDGFDWHVIFRFHDVNQCERVYKTISNVLEKCLDREHCYTHPYVKDIEYVGDTPAAR
eukprot:CAMPEP_0178429318 /NCGR_PEP_ID=MMETSP0689_2-20121128/30738_1 /TAXON_ID=160604 /ORGANISM="Amphidinium massartii, Strain CS-259" /LENGTH=237 /DNA_ID=CAMNT_0020051131 /DNA_START=1 /DNA_END=710 /DNA_ORIENTATION=-